MLSRKFHNIEEVTTTLDSMRKINEQKGVEVKFVKPENLVGWEDKLNECLAIVDIVFGIHENLKTQGDSYSSEIKKPIFCKETYLSVWYDAKNYKFVLTCGSDIQEAVYSYGKTHKLTTNDRVYYVAARYRAMLLQLVSTMKAELPSTRYYDITSRTKIPKNLLPNSYVYFR